MPIEQVGDYSYYLLAVDADGCERTDDPDGLLSERVVQALRADAVTDVFIGSHGWEGEIPAACDQYARWIGAMLACGADRECIRRIRSGFRPLIGNACLGRW